MHFIRHVQLIYKLPRAMFLIQHYSFKTCISSGILHKNKKLLLLPYQIHHTSSLNIWCQCENNQRRIDFDFNMAAWRQINIKGVAYWTKKIKTIILTNVDMYIKFKWICENLDPPCILLSFITICYLFSFYFLFSLLYWMFGGKCVKSENIIDKLD